MISFALAGCLAVWLGEVQWSSKELPWSATENQWGQFPIDFDHKMDDFYFFFYFLTNIHSSTKFDYKAYLTMQLSHWVAFNGQAPNPNLNKTKIKT